MNVSDWFIFQLEKIKSYEAEVSQLRGLTQEQERSLKMAMKTTEQAHLNERNLNEEIDKLRSSLDKERNHLATVQVRSTTDLISTLLLTNNKFRGMRC